MEHVEIGSIDIRLSHTRRADGAVEKRLFVSLQERDIQDPLLVARAEDGERWVLLDGFKRYRCAMKLGMTQLPVECIGSDEVVGILAMLRRQAASGISALEQAALIQELHQRHKMSIYDIAVRLDRSPSWVSVRLGAVEEMSRMVREKIMTGAFPMRVYLYGLKGFTRVNKIPAEDVDACVQALSGKRLGTRDLDILWRAWFTGAESVRRLIVDGDIHRALRLLKDDGDTPALTPHAHERVFLEELKVVAGAMKRLVKTAIAIGDMNAETSNYVNIWCGAICIIMRPFESLIMEAYERTRPSGGGVDLLSARPKQEDDCAVAAP